MLCYPLTPTPAASFALPRTRSSAFSLFVCLPTVFSTHSHVTDKAQGGKPSTVLASRLQVAGARDCLSMREWLWVEWDLQETLTCSQRLLISTDAVWHLKPYQADEGHQKSSVSSATNGLPPTGPGLGSQPNLAIGGGRMASWVSSLKEPAAVAQRG